MEESTFTAIMMTIAAVVGLNVMFLLVIMRAMARDREALIELGELPAEAPRPAAVDPAGLRRAPIGTLAILLLFLLVTLGAWSSVFILLVQRG